MAGTPPAPPAGAGHDVLPYFRALETDCDFDGPRTAPTARSRSAGKPSATGRRSPRRSTARSAADGVPDIADMNADFRDGHCALPISRYETSRASAAICYLTPQVRQRPNLRILADAAVERLEADGSPHHRRRRPAAPTAARRGSRAARHHRHRRRAASPRPCSCAPASARPRTWPNTASPVASTAPASAATCRTTPSCPASPSSPAP